MRYVSPEALLHVLSKRILYLALAVQWHILKHEVAYKAPESWVEEGVSRLSLHLAPTEPHLNGRKAPSPSKVTFWCPFSHLGLLNCRELTPTQHAPSITCQHAATLSRYPTHPAGFLNAELLTESPRTETPRFPKTIVDGKDRIFTLTT